MNQVATDPHWFGKSLTHVWNPVCSETNIWWSLANVAFGLIWGSLPQSLIIIHPNQLETLPLFKTQEKYCGKCWITFLSLSLEGMPYLQQWQLAFKSPKSQHWVGFLRVYRKVRHPLLVVPLVLNRDKTMKNRPSSKNHMQIWETDATQIILLVFHLGCISFPYLHLSIYVYVYTYIYILYYTRIFSYLQIMCDSANSSIFSSLFIHPSPKKTLCRAVLISTRRNDPN